ncbi:tumor necrosis factor receptor superfamily member 16-like isoform X2 [Sinocyclocheilus rhinocerous]|uniref:Tumor necrosis factor receptor superfamily member 16-like n=1 Tax=Sinocyclocheilus rhinocerous TaxID=307959 RepID=A0A673NCF3_9TELE|nr:PREDICTED: tumor necrosis factor receptor superfamily member 16-like isoform X1 [Sinocyclocheilus rhinocerous]XP_016424386.1 PREDICTED: tumor necrosis factor receptor superfamily member 16-like isoform X2 [Sinocyclocheilus rhinocerous]
MKGAMAALQLCLYTLAVKVAFGKVCTSEQFTKTGECYSMCAAGTGLANSYGQEDTKCQPCQDGVSFSDSESLLACRLCARCPFGIPELARCTPTQDTQCDCGERFFLWRDGNSTSGLCAACSMCGHGSGVVRACGPLGNTVCERCKPGTYSKERSDRKPCVPCSRCSDDEVEIRPCQPDSDTVCMVKDLNILSRPSGSDGPREYPRWPTLNEETENRSSPAPGSESPRLTPQDQGGNNNNILVYVSVLAAVVLGLLLYVAYKCWKSCQQKQALVKARVGELNNVGEGEKLHSDSGVFLDSHSLQESQPSKGSKRDSKQDTRLYVNLPPHRKDEVQGLLAEGDNRSWRQLAAALGYEQDRVDVFGRGQDPIHTLLTDWAQQEGSTLGLLCSALARIERPDIISALTAPSQGVSVV